MSWLQQLKKLYSLDTLDTRFTIPATTPPGDVATELRDSPSNSNVVIQPGFGGNSNGVGKGANISDVKPSLWRTPEFYFYYLVFLTVVPMMFKVSYDVSKSMLIDHCFCSPGLIML